MSSVASLPNLFICTLFRPCGVHCAMVLRLAPGRARWARTWIASKRGVRGCRSQKCVGVSAEFRAIFPTFQAMFPPFFRPGQNPFFGHFCPHFGLEARNGSIPGPRASNTTVCSSERVFRGFQRFSEVFQTPSQSAIFLSEFRALLPLIVLALKTPTIYQVHGIPIQPYVWFIM